MTIDEFEAFVQQQQSATKPWAPVSEYSFEARTAIEGRHPQLIHEVFQPRFVLDVGCGPGHLARLLRARGLTVCAADLALGAGADAILDIAGADCRPWRAKGYDLVICREVLEHLTVLQIRRAVRNLCWLSSKYLYITTRFSLPRWELSKALTSHPLLTVSDHDDLDPTHISLTTQDFLRMLFVLEGATRRADLEEQMDHMKKGRVLVYEVK